MALVLLLAALSVMIGSTVFSPADVATALLAPTGGESDLVITGVRIPRMLLAIAAGAALSVAGVVMQALTRNPLADPGILGVNAGASFAVALGMTVFGISQYSATLWLAFAGAALASIAVAALGASSRGSQSAARLVLGGVAVGAVLAGATSALSMLNPKAYATMRLWEAGSLAGRDLGVSGLTLALVTGGVVVALLLAPGLNVLVLGEDTASSLGSRIRAVRGWSLVTIVVLCGAATAAVGPIAFVGLMVPHAVRAVVGADQRTVLAYSLLAGPALLLVADLIARSVIRPHEVPIGVVTAILGAPLLVALVVFRRRAS
ncbi:FecCD family ABC transporter permease [Compostimonas suwonensis]|uniref:FecCD family ABC transporter permease n=1 Tax=Compostimonas suwonensis TaxID=1048394 RepID=UPI0012FD3603|nr:iron chelate uptake ABC transporter family permease subunit [Compostimonas suwonensis]